VVVFHSPITSEAVLLFRVSSFKKIQITDALVQTLNVINTTNHGPPHCNCKMFHYFFFFLCLILVFNCIRLIPNSGE